MSKKICSAWLLIAITACAGSLQAASSRTDAELIRLETGTYQIMQKIGQDTSFSTIGTETYTKKTYSSNTAVIEEELKLDYSVINPAAGVIQSSSRLELEDDSYFPRRYHIIRRSQGMEQELSIEMVANMALVTKRIDDRVEKETLALSTGAMFIEGNLVYHRALLLHRFSSSFPGKQSTIIFDPHLKRESTAVIDFIGEENVEVEGGVKRLKHFRISIEKLPDMDLYVNDEGVVLKATGGGQVFLLTSFEVKNGETAAGG